MPGLSNEKLEKLRAKAGDTVRERPASETRQSVRDRRRPGVPLWPFEAACAVLIICAAAFVLWPSGQDDPAAAVSDPEPAPAPVVDDLPYSGSAGTAITQGGADYDPGQDDTYDSAPAMAPDGVTAESAEQSILTMMRNYSAFSGVLDITAGSDYVSFMVYLDTEDMPLRAIRADLQAAGRAYRQAVGLSGDPEVWFYGPGGDPVVISEAD